MGRPRLAVPKYKRHKATGQGFSTIGTTYYWFGKHGTKESKGKYREFIGRLDSDRERQPKEAPPLTRVGKPRTVSAVATKYMERCLDGFCKKEADHYRTAIGLLVAPPRFNMRAADFGPLSLSEVRDEMVQRGWTREYVNAQVRRVRAVFRWAESLELVPAGKWHQLRSLPGLKKGNMPSFREVKPVADEVVEQTLPFLTPTVAAMVQFQRLTGCRPQDVCNLHLDDIDRDGHVWVARPGQHKNAWRGQSREVYIGPKAQAVIADRLGGGYVFSPRRACDEVAAIRRSKATGRKRDRSERGQGPRANIRDHYRVTTYRTAVLRGCRATGVEEWWPNQLRHAAGTEFREKFGLETTQKLLGHKTARTTERYAKPLSQSAVDAAGEVG